MTKVSEALQRVWDWKEAVYQDIKDLTPAERIEYYRKAAKAFEDSTGGPLDLTKPRRRARPPLR